MEDLAKNLRLTIKGCRRLLKERSNSGEVQLLRRILAAAEAQLEALQRQQKEK